MLGGCSPQPGLDAAASPATLDEAWFRCDVQPVLAARCAFLACHGSGTRPFRVYAPNRLRFDVPTDRRETPLTPDEERRNYDLARAFTAEDRLLLKPLAEEAGGWFHRGATLYGGDDVFLSTDDPGYRAIADWIAGATAAPDCVPTTEVGP